MLICTFLWFCWFITQLPIVNTPSGYPLLPDYFEIFPYTCNRKRREPSNRGLCEARRIWECISWVVVEAAPQLLSCSQDRACEPASEQVVVLVLWNLIAAFEHPWPRCTASRDISLGISCFLLHTEVWIQYQSADFLNNYRAFLNN
jgi:hypothetical protein